MDDGQYILRSCGTFIWLRQETMKNFVQGLETRTQDVAITGRCRVKEDKFQMWNRPRPYSLRR